MTEETKTTQENTAPATPEKQAPEAQNPTAKQAPERNDRRGGRPQDRRRGRGDRRGPRRERPKPEFDQKIVDIRRVTRVMAGGRRFSFSVSMVIGDRKGRVGVGIGKSGDTSLAIDKAIKDARKNMIQLKLTQNKSIERDIATKYAASRVTITPAPGRGLIAGSSVRTVLELAGVTDVTSKILSRSKNKLNNARAAVQALKLIPSTTLAKKSSK